MKRGRFIVLEGGEGAGKTTQLRLLAEALNERGIAHLVTREPGGTDAAEALRTLLLDNRHDWGARAEALLFAAARSDHVEKLILPALQSGKWVLCDRFLDSSRAYQGRADQEGSGAGDGLDDEDIVTLHRIGSGGLVPDICVLIEIDRATAQARTAARDGDAADRIGARNADFHAGVAARFDALAKAEPHRFVRISGEGAPDDVHRRILAALFA